MFGRRDRCLLVLPQLGRPPTGRDTAFSDGAEFPGEIPLSTANQVLAGHRRGKTRPSHGWERSDDQPCTEPAWALRVTDCASLSVGALCGLCGGAMKVGDIPAWMEGPDGDHECSAGDGQIVHETCWRLIVASETD